MVTLDLFAAAGVRRGDARLVEQPFRYERGRAVSYRCPDCGALHPLNPRDWDEARGVYAGRDCGREPRIVAARSNSAGYQRRRYREDPGYRAMKQASDRRYRAARRAGGRR